MAMKVGFMSFAMSANFIFAFFNFHYSIIIPNAHPSFPSVFVLKPTRANRR